MPRYELTDKLSSKFWEAARKGETVTLRWGRIGGKPLERSRSFDDGVEAQRWLDERTAEKRREGYRPAGAAPKRKEKDATPDARGASLLAAVLAAPDDPAPRLVFADWLTEQGDPWGEL